jgi:2,3-dihydroxyphenylpropionate 1,2-dioxygenase
MKSARSSPSCAEVEAFDPELVFLFAPDHYNGFFLDAMPQLCIGTGHLGGRLHDLAGPAGRAAGHRRSLRPHVVARDIDLAVSYRMQVDHGFAQPLEELTGSLARYPVIPSSSTASRRRW